MLLEGLVSLMAACSNVAAGQQGRDARGTLCKLAGPLLYKPGQGSSQGGGLRSEPGIAL